jgi:hypothetical protein
LPICIKNKERTEKNVKENHKSLTAKKVVVEKNWEAVKTGEIPLTRIKPS